MNTSETTNNGNDTAIEFGEHLVEQTAPSVAQTTTETPAASPTEAQVVEEAGNEESYEDTTQTQTQTQTTARILEGLDDEEKKMFIRMPRASYERLYPLYLKSRDYDKSYGELQKKYDEQSKFHLYEAPDAYKITPEYNELANTVDRLSGEAMHWRDQLIAIEAGQNWTDLELDQNTGRYTEYTKTPSPAAKAEVLAKLTHAYQLQREYTGKRQQYEQQFSQQHQNYLKSLQEVENKIFSVSDKDKLNKLAEQSLEMFPAYVRNKPEVRMLAKAYVLMQGLTKLRGQEESAQKTNSIKKTIAKTSGPTNSNVQPSQPTGKTAEDYAKQWELAAAGHLE